MMYIVARVIGAAPVVVEVVESVRAGRQRERLAAARALYPEAEVTIQDTPPSADEVEANRRVSDAYAEAVRRCGSSLLKRSGDEAK